MLFVGLYPGLLAMASNIEQPVGDVVYHSAIGSAFSGYILDTWT